jgi:hypothetical protein
MIVDVIPDRPRTQDSATAAGLAPASRAMSLTVSITG